MKAFVITLGVLCLGIAAAVTYTNLKNSAPATPAAETNASQTSDATDTARVCADFIADKFSAHHQFTSPGVSRGFAAAGFALIRPRHDRAPGQSCHAGFAQFHVSAARGDLETVGDR